MPPIKGKMHDYSESDMQSAYDEVKSGVPIATAAKKYKVPYTTLNYKVNGKTPVERCRMGPTTYLSHEQENVLVLWILDMAKAGFPVSVPQLQDSVCKIVIELKIQTPFKNNKPGRHWTEAFQKRHPEISLRTAQNLTESRASVSEQQLIKWFEEVSVFFKDNNLEHVLLDPRRVFNADETAFFLNPKGYKVLAAKGDKNVYQKVNADEKECLTVLVTGNAAGDVPPPMVVFQYERIPRELALSIPGEWGVGRSENGWMTGETFYEFISNVFNPWLDDNAIEKPVVLFIDGHTSHLTLQTSKLCTSNGIILVALYPNATHLLQPMDVAVFRSLKMAWKQAVQEWRLENIDNPRLKKVHFCPLLKEVLDKTLTRSLFINGFRKCGLCPWDSSAVVLKTTEKTIQKGQEMIKELRQGLVFVEKYIKKETLQEFKKTEEWTGNVEDKSLFYFWKNIKELQVKNGSSQEQATLNETDTDIEPQNNNQDISMIEPDSIVLEESEALLSIETRDFLNSSDVGRILTDLDLVNKNYVTPVKSPSSNNPAEPSNEKENNRPLENDSSTFYSEQQPSTSKGNPIIPTPFKHVLFWPKNKGIQTKKRKTEKIPAVVTSIKWQEYHENKEKKKADLENQKAKRAEERKKKKEEKDKIKKVKTTQEKKKPTKKSSGGKIIKKVLFDSSSDSEELQQWQPSDSSTNDLNSDDDLSIFNSK